MHWYKERKGVIWNRKKQNGTNLANLTNNSKEQMGQVVGRTLFIMNLSDVWKESKDNDKLGGKENSFLQKWTSWKEEGKEVLDKKALGKLQLGVLDKQYIIFK